MALRPIPDRGVLKEADAFRQASRILNACPRVDDVDPCRRERGFCARALLKVTKYRVADTGPQLR